MARLSGREEVYTVAERFVAETLRKDGSHFTPGTTIWSAENIEDLYERFVGNPIETQESFEDKFRRQLEGAPLETRQLAAELLYVYLLFPRNIRGYNKRRIVHEILDGTEMEVPDDLDQVLEHGIANFGPALQNRPWQLTMLLEFFREWKTMPEREEVLSDPWRFKSIVFSVPHYKAGVQREALLHLVYPDTFERIVSQDHKRDVAKHFSYLTSDDTQDVDRRILGIREELAPKYGDDFDFYDTEEVKYRWENQENEWDAFVRWARKFYEWGGFDENERDYKLLVASRLAEARDALFSENGDWTQQLKRGFGSPNNLAHWRQSQPFLKWCETNTEAAARALHALWDGTATAPERMRRFAELLPWDIVSGRGGRLALASVLLLAEDPLNNPIYRAGPLYTAKNLLGYPLAGNEVDEGELYEQAVEFIDRFTEEAASRGLDLRDRLDAQSLIWCVSKWQAANEPVTSWSENERRAFLKYRGEPVEDDLEDKEDESPLDEDVEKDGLALLAQELLLNYDYLSRIDRLLRDKRQIIFYGPPGTGKTFVARRLAGLYGEGSGGSSLLVQFHPSYSYEDFVEGYRPRSVGGQPGFALVDGPLKNLAREASKNRDAKYVLVIDEVNRANLTKVMGELYFLLEYRGESVTLQYSGGDFSLPENLWIICTMNTADRSIALVDAALRRRFYFAPFFPDEPPVTGLLRRWLERQDHSLLWVADVMDEANRRLGDRQVAIGPSYFLREDLTEEWVEIIWEHAVLPYLSEQFFDEEERLAEFDLLILRSAVVGIVGRGADETTDAQ